jgi:acetyl-CoA acetyltransferase
MREEDELSGIRDKAAIVGIGQTEFSKNSGRSELQLACEAIKAACDDAGISVHEIDGMVRYNYDTNDEVMLVSSLGLENLRYFGEIGWGGSAHCSVVGHAAMAVALGIADVVVCFRALNERSGRRLGLARDHRVTAASTQGELTGLTGFQQFTDTFGMMAPNHRFGMLARRHMIEYGTTSEHFGQVAVTIREHANRNPNAMMHGKPMTLADHQASRMIADPMRLFDCCLESDGAVALIVTSAERARDLRHPPAYIMGASQGSGPDPNGIVFRPDLATTEATYTARDVYRSAGVGPEDIDVAGFYDHFSPFVIFALEAYGFCAPGEGGPFVAEGRIAWPDGDIPVNTHGGNLSEAYIHGLTHVVEAVRQLRGTSTAQVVDAEVALVGSAVAQLSSALILRK